MEAGSGEDNSVSDEEDLLTISIDVAALWEIWDPKQRDKNLHEPAVAQYMVIMNEWANEADPDAKLALQKQIKPIIFDGVDFGTLKVRTADGRHRITAAHRLELPTIQAIGTETAKSIKAMFSL